jgi:hypothetical protein
MRDMEDFQQSETSIPVLIQKAGKSLPIGELTLPTFLMQF